jgi:hypothetical protein
MLSLTDISSKKEYTELAKVDRVTSPAKGHDYSISHINSYKYYEGGTMTTEVKNDTLFASGKISPSGSPKLSKKLSTADYWFMVLLIFVQIIYVTMVYGPIAAFLVELFPTKIRYTSMSLPYHIGNGVFGGLTPFIATLLTTIYTSDKLVGLWYPIVVASICLVIGTLYISNKIDPDVTD